MAVSSIELTTGGPTCSRIVQGMWRVGDWGMTTGDLLGFIQACLDLGITTFDHADIYGDYTCEQRFGEALALNPSFRNGMQLVTKCGIKLVSKHRPQHTIKYYDTSKAHIIASVEHSLNMLQTDRIDILLLHRPDPLMNADEVAGAFSSLRKSGKVLSFGVSNFLPGQFELLASRLDFPLVTNQVEISVLNLEHFENGTIDFCKRKGITPMAWSPWSGGRLFTEESERANRLRSILSDIGDELDGATVGQVALAWLLGHPSRIIPVLGTGRIDRVRESIQAESLTLSREQWFKIWSASTGCEVP